MRQPGRGGKRKPTKPSGQAADRAPPEAPSVTLVTLGTGRSRDGAYPVCRRGLIRSSWLEGGMWMMSLMHPTVSGWTVAASANHGRQWLWRSGISDFYAPRAVHLGDRSVVGGFRPGSESAGWKFSKPTTSDLSLNPQVASEWTVRDGFRQWSSLNPRPGANPGGHSSSGRPGCAEACGPRKTGCTATEADSFRYGQVSEADCIP
jgi:hypothetical protein